MLNVNIYLSLVLSSGITSEIESIIVELTSLIFNLIRFIISYLFFSVLHTYNIHCCIKFCCFDCAN